MENLWKKLLGFFGLCAYAVGVIGGVLASGLGGSWFVAVCVAALGAMAFPTAKFFWGLLKA